MQPTGGKDVEVKSLAVAAAFSALIMLATMFLKIPGPTGYYHLGDGMLYAAAIILGPARGAVTGAVGSSLADLAGGFPVWAPWTFVIKGVVGYVIGSLAKNGTSLSRNVLAMVAGAIITIAGYSLATALMYGIPAMLVEIYGNIGQTVSGILVALAFLSAFRKALTRFIGT